MITGKYQPKPAFISRIKELLDSEEDVKKFFEVTKSKPRKSIRVNTIKINVEELVDRLKKKGWEIEQPFINQKIPEIIVIKSELKPGELGNSREHVLGYYYVQEITSMMPILALQPKSDELFLDLCASPGSKTTQAAAIMKNQGSIIANDVSLARISILSANLEKCGVTNTIVTRHDGVELCKRLKELNFKFNKILVDAPCSGEGNIRCSPRTFLEWSEGLLNSLSGKQKKLLNAVVDLLKSGGELVYSTCTYAPEENEAVVQNLLDNYNFKIPDIRNKIPLKTRSGLIEWRSQKFSDDMEKAVRIYHHDNNLEGFFLCKLIMT